MSTPTNSPQDEGTYFINAENAAEMARLTSQDRLLTKTMGGFFQREIDLVNIHDILDIACGPGGWVFDIATAYPEKQVTGIDIGRLMVEYAKAQAREKRLNNAHFQVMDALKTLDFPDNSFDLVNIRFVSGFMPKVMWSPFMLECVRVVRSGGIVRLTEGDAGVTNSPSSEAMSNMLARALYLAGMSFSPDGRNFGISPMLAKFLHDAGCINIQKKAYVLDFSAGMEAHTGNYQNLMIVNKLLQPFLIKFGVTTQEEVEVIYQRMLSEMQSEDFCGLWYLLSVWGSKPF